LHYHDKFKTYEDLVMHLVIIKKEIFTHKSILYKTSKEFIKKFGNDKNKDKNYKLNKDKNSQSSNA